ncbi:hypothetical protein [Clostridium lundense]|uniref:hypothetical protein n=1 Tax=Clostridium lundense TaxID=319475 RepID=UPI0005530E95|nr:hypothetical protein [Clostridium lundense]
MNKEKIEFLNKYTLSKVNKVNLLTTDDVKKIPDGVLPKVWKDIFSEKNVDVRKRKMLDVWRSSVGKEMSNTISFLNEHLIDIEIMNIGEYYSVLYTVKNQDNKIKYYEGNNPCDKRLNKKLNEYWSVVPDEIKRFYDNVHNGFYYYPSKGMGLDSYNDVTCLWEEEWGIIEDIGEENLKLNLLTSFGFFNNSLGTYVVVDCEKGINDAILWSSKDEPEYNLKFWDVVDEWMVIGFQN